MTTGHHARPHGQRGRFAGALRNGGANPLLRPVASARGPGRGSPRTKVAD